jgi:Cdc6-like AAA superfamily ATPase
MESRLDLVKRYRWAMQAASARVEAAQHERNEAARKAAEARENERRCAEISAQAQQRERERLELERRRQALRQKLSAPIPLKRVADARSVIFGTDTKTGADIAIPVKEIPHLLVVGTSGFGKSVFLHQVIHQLSRSPEVDRMVLIDLKGGVEFDAYATRNKKCTVVWQFDDVVTALAEVMTVMLERQTQMKAKKLRNWKGGRVFVVVDEFAQIQLWPTLNREQKDIHARLIADFTRLSMLGRAMGIVIVAAIQKPTTDVMDSSLRSNMQGQVCFRIASRQLAASIFPDLDDLPADPVTLPRGRFVFYNANTGETHCLKAHVAPEAKG